MKNSLGPGPWLLAIGLLLMVVIILSGCGGSTDEDPREVARMYVAAEFSCGDEGAGRQYDLSASANRDWSRDEYLRIERMRGCREQPVPKLDVALLDKESDVARVEVRDAAGRVAPRLLIVVRLNGEWKVDTLRSHAS